MKKYITFLFLSLFILAGNVKALTEAPIDITSMSMLEIKDALDNHIITSEQLVNIYLDRINTYNDKFNVIRALNGGALDDARELDKLRSQNKIKGPLHGIPILIKTNIDVYNLPTTGGTKSLEDNYPNENAEVVQKLIDAGAIIIGSTNMSELAFAAGNSDSSYGSVKNAFNTKYTPFGSSCGSAVGVKVFFASAALGTDTNLSVRVPASAAGLVGMRPTLYTLSSKGVIPYDTERDTVGILTNSVNDNMLIYSVLSGNKVAKSEEDLKKVKIGVITEYTKGSSNSSGVTGATDKDIYKLIESSIEVLKNGGAEIIELNNFVRQKDLTTASTSASGLTLCDGFNEYIKGTTGTIRSFKELANSKDHTTPLSDYLPYCGKSTLKQEDRNTKKKDYRDYVDKVFDEYDLDAIIYPTVKNKIPELGKGGVNSPGGVLPSVIGYPAITVPMGSVGEFSYGIEFLGLASTEEYLYNIASNFEKYNNNEVSVTELAPSLYQVPESVTELVNIYKDSKNNKAKKLTLEFFKNYNSIENKNDRARELIEEYNKKSNPIFLYLLYSLLAIVVYGVVIHFIDN